MVTPLSNPRRVAVLAGLATVAIFGALIALITVQLRERVRAEVLQREAEAIHAVAKMQIANAEERLELPAEALDELLFFAVLESSKLRGVFTVHVYDARGALHDSLRPPGARKAPERWWPAVQPAAAARFTPETSLEEALGYRDGARGQRARIPLLEVVVPLESGTRGPVGAAHYWIDGAPLAAEFARIDRALAQQAGIAFAGGALLITLVLALAFAPLVRTQRQLLEQSADLARANAELDFAAKTGALGAISAHLIHGLKNPLAGIEGFVAEHATGTADPIRGQAWRSAMETTQRLRGLVNEVVTVLRDDETGQADYRVPVAEMVDSAKARLVALAAEADVRLVTEAEPGAELTARVANLAGLVLANLLTNAIQATPRGGKVSLSAQVRGERVEFRIADSGAGLPAGVQAALFRPVQSQKPGGGGLGLAISHRLARHAGGELELVRSDSSGTVFRLSVPAFART